MTMGELPVFTLRPLEGKTSETLAGAFRIYLHPDDARILRLETGDLCRVTPTAESPGHGGIGIVWPSSTATKKIIKSSHAFKDAYGFKLGDKLQVSKYDGDLHTVSTVKVREISAGSNVAHPVIDDELVGWVKHALLDLEALWIGGHFDVTPRVGGRKGRKRTFAVDSLETIEGGASVSPSPSILRHDSVVILAVASNPLSSMNEKSSPITNEVKDIDKRLIGGLDAQLEILNEHIRELRRIMNKSERNFSDEYSQFEESTHILLYGAPGTGKTLLLQQLRASFQHNYNLETAIDQRNISRLEEGVRRVFTQAISTSPSLITIDNLSLLAGKSDAGTVTHPAAGVLKTEIDRLGRSKVLVVAATQTPNEVDAALRLSFGTEIETPIPDADARLEILKTLWRSSKGTDNSEILQVVADRTHGYVGRDLKVLSQKAFMDARKRLASPEEDTPNGSEKRQYERPESLLLADFEKAFDSTTPSAMREVFLETPKVEWSDIGGSDHVKNALSAVVDFPFRRPDIVSFNKLFPPRGILLYGPPGCSKTLTAKAVATSSGLNFLSVKGAELTSMYVGETERAVREVFRKARAAKPAVIFFDEIDAIAASRVDERGRSAGGTSGLNVLTTLLTEMDGIESLDSVLVLAATNRPEVLDPALLRPGRFESLLYVSPPSLAARRQIFQIGTKQRHLLDDVDLNALASITDGFSGADIVGICNKAAWTAGLRSDRRQNGDLTELLPATDGISMDDFRAALQQRGSSITSAMISSYEAWAGSLGGVTQI